MAEQLAEVKRILHVQGGFPACVAASTRGEAGHPFKKALCRVLEGVQRCCMLCSV